MSWDEHDDLDEPFEIPSRPEDAAQFSPEFVVETLERFAALELPDPEVQGRARELISFWSDFRPADSRRMEKAGILEACAALIATEEMRSTRASSGQGYCESEAIMEHDSDPWYWKSEQDEYSDRLDRWADRVRSMGHDPDAYLRDAGLLDDDEEV